MKLKNSPEIFKSKTPKTYKNKKLNSANFGDFTHNDYQVFLHLVSKIGGINESGKYLQPEQLQRQHTLTAKEFSKLFKTDLSHSYKLLNKACKKLMKTSIMLEKIELNEVWEINVCSAAKYSKQEGRVTVKFTDDIMPYLAQVRKKFVLYNLKEIANFGSLYTTRLYELIQEFKETGWMLKSLEQLRTIFVVGDKFKMYGHFKTKILNHARQEINNNYDMGLMFEEIKEGRKVVAVKFFFKQTIVNQVTNQKTGETINIYTKPKTQLKIKNSKSSSSHNNLGDQISSDQTKSFGSVVNSLIFEKITLK